VRLLDIAADVVAQEPDFTENRIVVREEDIPQKKGWFGSRRKKAKSSVASVSRPPSTAGVQSDRKSSVDKEGLEEDELPPREEKSSAVAAATTAPPKAADFNGGEQSGDLGEQGSAPSEPSSLPPARAGFDIHAIKAAIGKEDLKEEAIKLPSQTAYSIPHMRREMGRSGSAPPPQQDTVPPSPVPAGRSSMGSTPNATTAEATDLPSMLSRSMSLNTVKIGDGEEMTSSSMLGQELPAEDSTPRNSPFSSSSAGIPWSAGPTKTVPGMDTYVGPFANPFNDPAGYAPASATSLKPSPPIGGSPYSTGLTPPANPFGASLTFGDAGGSITTNMGGSGGELDPWSVTGGKKSRADSFASNPWS
jgi:hypothetical protein